MTVWTITAVLRPRGALADCSFLRAAKCYTNDLTEADDVDCGVALAVWFPGFSVERVLSCVATERGDAIVPRRAA